jgi:phage-related protein
MTLIKVAKKVTPQVTYYAYVKVIGNKQSFYWRNPNNNKLLPITSTSLKTWKSV